MVRHFLIMNSNLNEQFVQASAITSMFAFENLGVS